MSPDEFLEFADGLNRLSASVRIWTDELLQMVFGRFSLNRLSASVRIWTEDGHPVTGRCRQGVLIAFRLQSEFGQIHRPLRPCRRFLWVLIAFRLQSEFGHLLRRLPVFREGTGVLIAFRLQSEFGLLYSFMHRRCRHSVLIAFRLQSEFGHLEGSFINGIAGWAVS